MAHRLRTPAGRQRAALNGDAHGWIFPERAASAALLREALASGDSRVVRYAEKILAGLGARAEASPPPSNLVYVTTRGGVTRVPYAEVAQACVGCGVIVDTLAHELRASGSKTSLERRRALEPLVVQLLRRAREGLSAEEILRAAGGPGPESADAEHRVRVLISRVRDLLGDPAAIERVRDAGEYGKTRYRLAPNVNFALVEPLFSSAGNGQG